MENLTKEQIQKHISSAYDSVSLINYIKTKETVSEIEVEDIERNVEHLKIMMSKDWFFNELTSAQKNEINTIIA